VPDRAQAGAFVALGLGSGLVTGALAVLVAAGGADDAVPSLMGITASIAGFVSVFVVAGTFALSVAQRRRELALRRLIGATGGQVRRAVLGDALIVSLVAGPIGALLGWPISALFEHLLVVYGLASGPIHATPTGPVVLVAVGSGVVVAQVGAFAAARRAARIAPVEAFREAATDRRVMTGGRWCFGTLFLGGGVAMTIIARHAGAEAAIALANLSPEVLVVGLTAFAPLLVRPLVGLLARFGVPAPARRTAATAAPVLVTVAIAAAVLVNVGSVAASTTATTRAHTTATSVVLGPVPLPTVDAVRRLPGVVVAAPIVERPDVVGVDPASYAATQRRMVAHGSLADLHGATVAVSAEMAGWYGWTVGARVELAGMRLRIVAILGDLLGAPDALVPLDALRPSTVDRILVSGGSPADLRQATGARVVTADAWLADDESATDRANTFALLVMIGLTVLYTTIAIANTLLMTAGARRRDVARLRLAGATRAQVVRALVTETLAVVATGVGLGAAAALCGVVGLRAALVQLTDTVRIAVPWATLGLIVVTSTTVALAAVLLPLAASVRSRP
jgi:putative ABC transport system permease protein